MGSDNGRVRMTTRAGLITVFAAGILIGILLTLAASFLISDEDDGTSANRKGESYPSAVNRLQTVNINLPQNAPGDNQSLGDARPE